MSATSMHFVTPCQSHEMQRRTCGCILLSGLRENRFLMNVLSRIISIVSTKTVSGALRQKKRSEIWKLRQEVF
jgi:hypothetical protein